ncbi:MAG TPA: Rieske 2Fe-2S domain-containing protein [Ilumatobacter sp.]
MTWVTAGDIQAITRARKTVIDVDGYEVLVLAHDGNLYSFQNRCIHKQRELAKGVVLNGKLVCPGHQWAFALDSGWEAIKEERQPMFPVRVVDGIVEVEVTIPEPSPATLEFGGASVVAVNLGRSSDSDIDQV